MTDTEKFLFLKTARFMFYSKFSNYVSFIYAVVFLCIHWDKLVFQFIQQTLNKLVGLPAIPASHIGISPWAGSSTPDPAPC